MYFFKEPLCLTWLFVASSLVGLCGLFGLKHRIEDFVCLFVCFVALRPKSTAMVIAGRSVHLTTLFPGQA